MAYDRASVTGIAGVIAGTVIKENPVDLFASAAKVVLVSWLASAAVGVMTPKVESSVDALAPRRLGVIGAILIVPGLLTQSVQYWLVILDFRTT